MRAKLTPAPFVRHKFETKKLHCLKMYEMNYECWWSSTLWMTVNTCSRLLNFYRLLSKTWFKIVKLWSSLVSRDRWTFYFLMRKSGWKERRCGGVRGVLVYRYEAEAARSRCKGCIDLRWRPSVKLSAALAQTPHSNHAGQLSRYICMCRSFAPEN